MIGRSAGAIAPDRHCLSSLQPVTRACRRSEKSTMLLLRNIAILAIATVMLDGCIGMGKLCQSHRDCQTGMCVKFPGSSQGNCASGKYYR